MATNLNLPPRTNSNVFIPIVAGAIGILTILTLMAGLPTENQAAFIIGVLILISLTIGIGVLGWYLLVRPLPANVKEIAQPLISTRSRHVVALLLTLGVLNIGMAGVWDEVWHTKYGIPFGQDFFWRPHLLLYFGFLSMIGVGAWAWWTMMRKGKGTLQQRFRANPILGVSALMGLFTAYAVGADPIWHILVYKKEIAPWSIPHLLLLTLIFSIGLMAIAYHKSVLPQREWKLTPQLHWRDILIPAALSGALMDFMLILTIDWYGARSSQTSLDRVITRPDWMLGLFLVFLATMFGVTALHATRRVGTATMMGLIAVALRVILQTSINSLPDNGQALRVPPNGVPPLLVILPILLALDILYAIIITRTKKPPVFWMIAIVITAVFGVVSLPLVSRLFVYPQVNMATIPGLLIGSALAAVVGAWLGQLLGDTGRYGHEALPSEATLPRWVNPVLYAGFLVFMILFVVTAVPPIPPTP
jgi:hypothetical protein